MCQVAPFSSVGEEKQNGIKVEVPIYTYEISDTVKVVDGSLYSKVPMGWELIIYTGLNPENVKIPEDTCRITSMAFAGSQVGMVQTPFTVEAIGHKAFFGCNNLHTVCLGSYNAPIMEEEYDPTYYDSFEHVPGSGDYGTYTDYAGNEVPIYGMGLVPYFMWNVTGGLYHNVFYGANFVDYVGYVEDKLTLVRPVNGKQYDSFIMNQYFDVRIDGPQAPDEAAAAAIHAIKLIPERVKWEDKALVDAARTAYDKVATTLQQGLVSNYSDLVSAEQRIKLLDPANKDKEEDKDTNTAVTPEEPQGLSGIVIFLILIGILALLAVLGYVFRQQLAAKFEVQKAAVEKALAEEMAAKEVSENETEN